MSRRAALVVLIGLFTLAAGVLIAQGPPRPNPTVARLQTLKLDVVTGDVPAYYSKDFTGAAPGLSDWLAQRGAVQPPQKLFA